MAAPKLTVFRAGAKPRPWAARLAWAAMLVACGCGGTASQRRDAGDAADAADAAPTNEADVRGDSTSADASPDLPADQAATTDVVDGQVETGGRGGGAGGNGGGGNGSTGGSSASGGAGAGGAGAVSLAISVDRAVANGWSLIPVSVQTNGVSVPTSAELTFSLSRLDAGTLRPRLVAAGAVDPQLYFTPCDGTTTPSCLGPVTIRVARSSAPETLLAETPVLTLTGDMDVGSPAGCLLARNALLLEGNNNSILFGISFVREGTFDPAGAAHQRIKLGVNPVGEMKPTYGAYWNIEVNGSPMDLAKGIYRKSAGAAQTMMVARTNVSSGCSAGAFQILDLVWAGNQLETFLATFDLACGTIGTTLRGCVRFSAQ